MRFVRAGFQVAASALCWLLLPVDTITTVLVVQQYRMGLLVGVNRVVLTLFSTEYKDAWTYYRLLTGSCPRRLPII
jgi:hypothetical protein